MTVADLNFRRPLMVNPKISCQNAIEMMKHENFEQIAIVDETGKNIFGVATVANLINNLLAGKISADSPVEKILSKQFQKVIFLQFFFFTNFLFQIFFFTNFLKFLIPNFENEKN